jgi:hypothetical protein
VFGCIVLDAFVATFPFYPRGITFAMELECMPCLIVFEDWVLHIHHLGLNMNSTNQPYNNHHTLVYCILEKLENVTRA